jgi:hypothetical protein
MTPRSAAENVALSLSATSERLRDRSGHARFGRRAGAEAETCASRQGQPSAVPGRCSRLTRRADTRSLGPPRDSRNNPCRREGDQVIAPTSTACRCSTASMDTSSQRLASALPPMQERHGLRSGAGGRLPLVPSERARRACGDARFRVRSRSQRRRARRPIAVASAHVLGERGGGGPLGDCAVPCAFDNVSRLTGPRPRASSHAGIRCGWRAWACSSSHWSTPR